MNSPNWRIPCGGPRSTKTCFLGHATPDRCSQTTGIAAVFHHNRYVTLLTTMQTLGLHTMKSITSVPATFYEPRTNMHHHLIYLANAQHITSSHYHLRSVLTNVQIVKHVTCVLLQHTNHKPPSTVWQVWFRPLRTCIYSNHLSATSLMVRSQPSFTAPNPSMMSVS